MRRRVSRTPTQREHIREAYRMTTERITKALDGAERILKGDAAPGMRSDELEAAMVDYAATQARGDESSAQAFARLSKAGDETIEKLWAATDVTRVSEQHSLVLQKRENRGLAVDLIKRAESLVDDFVRKNQLKDETFEAAHLRLGKNHDEMYTRLVEHYTECHRLL